MMRALMAGVAVAASVAIGACGSDDGGKREVAPARPVSSSGCSPVSYGGKGRPDFLIAAVTPLQGAFIDHGVQTVQALKMVLDGRDWRAGDYSVGLQVCDETVAGQDEANPKRCRRHARAFARNRSVIAFEGPLFSTCAREMLAILNRAPGGPLATISASNTYLGLTRSGAGVAKDEPDRHYPTGRRHYARLAPLDDAQSAAVVLYAKEHGARRAFVLDDDEAYGFGIAEAFSFAAKREGMEVVGRAQWDPKARDYRALGERARKAGADSVFLGGLPTNNGPQLIKDMREALGPDAQILTPDAFNQPANLVEGAGEAAEGVVITIAVFPTRALPEEGRKFAAEFEKRFGARPCCYSVHSAEATEIVLDAIADSDGTRAQVLANIFDTKVENGLLGDFEIDRYGDTTQGAIGVYRIEGGRLRFDRTITPPRNLLARR